jgi:pilus assembly protein Flp/PilA
MGLERNGNPWALYNPAPPFRGNSNMKVIIRFWSDESGATAIEYGLLAALISVVIIGTVKVAGTNLSAKFQTIANNLS